MWSKKRKKERQSNAGKHEVSASGEPAGSGSSRQSASDSQTNSSKDVPVKVFA